MTTTNANASARTIGIRITHKRHVIVVATERTGEFVRVLCRRMCEPVYSNYALTFTVLSTINDRLVSQFLSLSLSLVLLKKIHDK